MENKFETILLKYGAKVLIDVRFIIEHKEMYEDCQVINDLLTKYGIDTNFDLNDWQASIYEFVFAGDVAKSRIGIYLDIAMEFLYRDIKFNNPYYNVGKLFFNPLTGEIWSES